MTKSDEDFQSDERRPVMTGLGRGLRRRCPNCGRDPAFAGYLKIRSVCRGCAHPLGEYRCDDAPPYFTMLIVGHVVVPGALSVEQAFSPALWLQMAIWLPLTLILSLTLLPLVKGAILGTQWAMRIKG